MSAPPGGQAAAARARRDEAPRRQDRDGHGVRRAGRALRRGRRRRRDPRRRHRRDGRPRPRGHDGARDDGRDDLPDEDRVARAAYRPIVVGDMPFGSYQVSDEDAVRNAIRFVKEARADVVKLEGAGPSVSRARAIVGAGIPVMGHVGLTPQSATMLGGFKTQGKTSEAAARARRGRARARGGRALLRRPRGGPGAGRRGDHAAAHGADDRHRRRRATATARCSSTTTCSG